MCQNSIVKIELLTNDLPNNTLSILATLINWSWIFKPNEIMEEHNDYYYIFIDERQFVRFISVNIITRRRCLLPLAPNAIDSEHNYNDLNIIIDLIRRHCFTWRIQMWYNICCKLDDCVCLMHPIHCSFIVKRQRVKNCWITIRGDKFNNQFFSTE